MLVDTPIWTDKAWQTIGDLTTEDRVVAVDGSWSEIEYVSEVYTDHKCYEVAFSNGEEIVADADHLWKVIETGQHFKQHRQYIDYTEGTFTTEQLLTRGVYVKLQNRHGQLSKRFKLPHTDGYEGAQQSLPVDPYVFGYWLGDGSVHTGYFTIGNQDLEEVVELFKLRGLTLEHLSQKYNYRVEPSIKRILDALEVTRFQGETRETVPEVKHIPLQYFMASRSQRLELLRGLMDSDGHCQERGRCEVSLTETTLANDVCTLLSSLGFKYSRSVAPSSFNGESFPSHRMTFTPRIKVFNIRRKGESQILTPPKEHDIAVWIESIESTDIVPTKCIRIKHPSHTFLVGRTMIPTHNSESLLVEALRYVHVPKYTAVLFRRTFPELSQPRGLITRAHEICPLFKGTYNKQDHVWTFPSGSVLQFSHLEHEEDVHNWQSAEIAYAGFDELTSFTEYQFMYMQSRVRTVAIDPITHQVVPARVRWASNPGNVGHEWVFNRYKPWLTRIEVEGEPRWPSGEVHYFKTKDEKDIRTTWDDQDALSRSFIRSRRFDNPKLMEVDPGYEARLQGLPLVIRMQLAEGDWDIVAAGNVFHADWFKVINEVPTGLRWFRYWDLAASLKARASFTASGAVAVTKTGDIIIRDMIRKKIEWPDQEKLIKQTILGDETVVETGIEKKLHGIAAVQTFMKDPELTGHRIVGVDVDTDKLSRALDWSSKAEAGQVYLVNGPWIQSFLTECSLFDGMGKTPDDQVDTISGGVRMAASPKWRTMKFLHL